MAINKESMDDIAKRIEEIKAKGISEYADIPWLISELEKAQSQLAEREQRLEDVNVKDSIKTREINILTKENRDLRSALDVMRQALNRIVSGRTNAWGPFRSMSKEFMQDIAKNALSHPAIGVQRIGKERTTPEEIKE